MTTNKHYQRPQLTELRVAIEQGFAQSFESGLPSVDGDWTNKDYE